MINNKYKLLNKIGEGSFGSIYKGENCRTREEVAIKVEPISNGTTLLKNESKIYQYLLGTNCIPQVKWYGKDEINYYMVIPLLGNNLEQLFIEKQQQFSLKLILQIGIQILYLLKAIHEKGLVHRDIKPDNFLLGIDSEKNKLFLIDFGLCKTYIKDDKHIEMKQTSSLIGSLTYASINAHNKIELSRRDDLESLGYMLIYFSLGNLPWREIDFSKNINANLNVIQLKTDIIADIKIPSIIKEYINNIRNLEFKEEPNYELYIDKFTKEINRNNIKL
jgi:serine/threonine protein kinase